MMQTQSPAERTLLAANAELRGRLADAEETLRAIQSGEADALVVQSSAGPKVYVLQGLDAEMNRFHSEILAQVSDAVIAVDHEQRVTYFNAAAERQYGVTASEALGQCLSELYEFRWLRPEDAIASSEALCGTGYWRGENIHIKRNGEAIYVESSVSILRGADGESSGLLAIIRNITERKQAEEALAAAHRQTQNIIDNTTAIIYAFDLEERFLVANAALAKLLNSTPSQMIGKRRHEFMPQADADWHEANDRKAIEAGRALEFEEQSQLQGRSITWLTTKFPLRDAEGKIYAVGGFSADISERKRVEQALQDAQAKLKTHAENLETTVAERTAALRKRTAERERLQQELLRISEREKQLIAQELHDGLCQHFAGTAMMASLLQRRLAAQQNPEAECAKQVCELLNTGVHETRNLSHGLHPVKAGGDGLMEALSGLVQTVTNLFHVGCTFRHDNAVLVDDQTVATHLLRIAQEATNNAIKHGEARHVLLTLKSTKTGITLSIEDDGIGISRKLPVSSGMGMQSMKHRAEVIGAEFSIRRADKRGTVVSCTLPLRS